MSKKLVKISKNMRFLSTFFADPCANCSKFVCRMGIWAKTGGSFEFLVLSFELNITVDVVGQAEKKSNIKKEGNQPRRHEEKSVGGFEIYDFRVAICELEFGFDGGL